ncbi:ABC transporter ATP-binding protein/permease [Hoyosella sp. YIM 151337]|uniref:ABC transporter ATP-binding protein n=1 Tax=Hoyosella sp. YIM 151337 TaxID=2992742 RepID=UPI0022356E06|nr:ABC transporter ATP-binding protein [Hoyosella sp. YIM 151337]MCW4355138.1 ABC transporter ATP-binding protein/permease [Hoyosella sp. YIM 151337]
MPNHRTLPVTQGWLRRLIAQCLQHRLLVAGALGATFLAVGIEVAVPLVTKQVVDAAMEANTGVVGVAAIALVAMAVVRFGGQFVRRMLAGRLSLDVQHDLRLELLSALQRLDGKRQDEISTGQVVSRSISDLQQVQGLLAMAPLAAGAALQLVLSLGAMAYLSVPLTFFVLAVAPAIWLTVRHYRQRLYASTWSAQQRAADVAQHVEETVTGVRVVKGFGQESRMVDTLRGLARTLYGERMRSARINARFTPTMTAIPQLGLVLVIAAGSLFALRGTITIGTFLAFAAYLTAMTGIARLLSGLIVTAQLSHAAVERVFDVIDTEPHVSEPRHPQPLPTGSLGIEFRHVRFGFDPDTPVLSGLSLRVEPGECVALVGRPGSGKSTLAQLIPRFYAPDDGTVTVFGSGHRVNVGDVHPAELRQSIAVAFDEPFLFSDTIAANIALGDPDATASDIREAANCAQAFEFIDELGEGFGTRVGERGLTLSGGQRQRIALARALFARPRILVLDDATSAVDAMTESRILAALRGQTTPRPTIITIAHRRSSLRLADRIAVLDNGRIVDVGTETELLERCALFRELMATDMDEHHARASSRAATPAHSIEAAAPGMDSLWSRVPPQAAPPDGDRPELRAALRALPAVRDAPPEGRVIPATSTSFRLAETLRPVRYLLAAAIALLAIDAATTMLLPTAARIAIDSGVLDDRAGMIMWAVIAGIGLVVAGWAAAWGMTLLTARAGERILFNLRVRSFAHLQRLGMDYYERERSGRILTRMTTDIDALSTFLQTGLATAVVSVLMLVGVSTALLVTGVALAGIALVVLPILIAATVVFRRVSSAAYTQARERISTVNADFHENVAGLRTSQAYNREAHAAERFARSADQYRRSRMRAQRAIALYFPGIALLSDLALAIVLFAGAHRIADGTTSPGVLVAFVLYLGLLFTPIQQLSQVFDGYQQARVGLRRIADLLRTPESLHSRAPDALLPVGERTQGAFEFDAVCFSYPGTAAETPARAAAVLGDVDITLPPGSTTALVGPTGAGKSTIVKLLARFYDPVSGAVRASGVDIRDFALSEYRTKLGIVPQEPHLFTGDVASNIAFARPGAPPEAIEQAAAEVGALEMVARLPHGMHEPVGEGGRGLSSGERQLIALARAALAAPDLMLLDEATASLDPATENLVLRASERLLSSRTSVVVAHRLETAARADRILVVDSGAIIEAGTHEELRERGGIYANLWESSQSPSASLTVRRECDRGVGNQSVAVRD